MAKKKTKKKTEKKATKKTASATSGGRRSGMGVAGGRRSIESDRSNTDARSGRRRAGRASTKIFGRGQGMRNRGR